MSVSGASFTPALPPATSTDASSTLNLSPNASVRAADGLHGLVGLYEVTIDGATHYMTEQDVQQLGQSPEPTAPPGGDPTQQHGDDASRAPGLLIEKDPGGIPLPAPLPLPGGASTGASTPAR